MVRRDINLTKYNKRPSPPYSASKCPGLIKTGNDGQKYESRSDKNGRYAWRVVRKTTRKSTKKNPSMRIDDDVQNLLRHTEKRLSNLRVKRRLSGVQLNKLMKTFFQAAKNGDVEKVSKIASKIAKINSNYLDVFYKHRGIT